MGQFKEYLPVPATKSLIDSFWSFSGNRTGKSFLILPDGFTDVIFDLKRQKASVSGIMTTSQTRLLDLESEIVAIRLHTEAIEAISEMPLPELTNQKVDLDQVIPINQQMVFEKLSQGSFTDKIAYLQVFITKHLQHLNHPDPWLQAIVSHIKENKGNIDIGVIAKGAFMSVRQLERRFKTKMGLTLKEYAGIIRFLASKSTIESEKHKTLSQIAFQMGFFDPSHMNREFKRISGLLPSHFR